MLLLRSACSAAFIRTALHGLRTQSTWMLCRAMFLAAWQRAVTGDAWEATARLRSSMSDEALQSALCGSLVAAAAARCYSSDPAQRSFCAQGRYWRCGTLVYALLEIWAWLAVYPQLLAARQSIVCTGLGAGISSGKHSTPAH